MHLKGKIKWIPFSTDCITEVQAFIEDVVYLSATLFRLLHVSDPELQFSKQKVITWRCFSSVMVSG